MEHIAGLTRLELLSLRGAHVTDPGLSHLKSLTNLKYLWLEKAHVTDEGLAHLKGLTQLVYLSLEDTQITDAGLVHLKGLTRLRTGPDEFPLHAAVWIRGGLDLTGTQVTEKGIAELNEALPGRPAWRRPSGPSRF